MRLHHLAAALVFLACAAAAHAKTPPRLDVLAECKPNTSCIKAEVNIDADNVGVGNDTCAGPVVRIRGRLNGARAADYHVGFPGTCVEDCGDALGAYLGQSRDGNPVVQTTKGRLEILTKSVHIGAPDTLLLIDMTTGDIVRKYWGGTSYGNAFFVDKGVVYLLGERCFFAPTAAPRRFKVAPDEKCVEERFTHQLAPEQDEVPPPPVVEALRKFLGFPPVPGDGGSSFHLRGTNLWYEEFGKLCA